MNIVEEFPFFIPSQDFKEWNGIIIVEGEEVAVTMAVPNFPNIEKISLFCPAHWEVKIHLKLKKYNDLFSRKGPLIELLRFFKEEDSIIHDLKETSDERSSNMLLLQLYARVLDELRQVGSEAVVGCSDDLSRVTLHTVDRRGIDHQLMMGLPPDYPISPVSVVDADLPDVALCQLSQARTIIEIMNSFEKLIESLQDFWIVYEELKNSTWIIDPDNPRLKDTHCRIIVGENISMLVELDPQDISSCPDIKFLGPENLVTPFINSVENHLKTEGWSEDIGVCDNLLRLLGLTQFPRNDTEAEVDTTQEACSICFTVRSSGDVPLPVKVCNNTRCNSYFHMSCLAQWFQAVPTNEASFNLISGGCPSCGEKILCPITVT